MANEHPMPGQHSRAHKINHNRVGSIVGSLGRQGIQMPLPKRPLDQAKSIVFSDGLDSYHAAASAPTQNIRSPNNVFLDEFDDDGDGAVLEEGLFAPSEDQRIHSERQQLLDRSLSLNASTTARPYSSTDSHNRQYDEWEEAVTDGKLHTGHALELSVLLKNSIPLAITFFLQYSLTMASLFSVGHLGKVELAAVSLANMTSTATGIAFIQGMSTCLDTLCSQAYGAGRYDLVGMYFQKGVIVIIIFMLPILVVWYRADLVLPYLMPLGEENSEQLVSLATQYLRIMIFAMPGYVFFETGKRFLQAQGIFHASTIVVAVCAPINILLTYTLVWNQKVGLGFIGAPISVAITYTLLAFFLLVYVVFVDGSQCWSGFTRKSLRNWAPVIRLAIPGLIMVESEFLAYEILTLSASFLGTSDLAVQTIMSSITALVYEVPFAIGCAASTRIANFIGSGMIPAAKSATTVALVLSLLTGLFGFSIMLIFRHSIARMFSNDSTVISLAAEWIPYCAVMHIFDCVGAVLAAVLRGQGRQSIGGYLNLSGYYLFGVPLGLLLCFKLKMGVPGTWVGMNAALLFIISGSLIALHRSRWETYAELARSRNS